MLWEKKSAMGLDRFVPLFMRALFCCCTALALSSCGQGCGNTSDPQSRTELLTDADQTSEERDPNRPAPLESRPAPERAFRWLNPLPQGNYFRDVWGSGDELWFVGASGTVLHFDGENYRLQPTGTDSDLQGIWGSSPQDIWAVGTNFTVIHYDGTHWTPIRIDLPDDGTRSDAPAPLGLMGRPIVDEGPTTLDGIWGSGPNDVWIVNCHTPEVIHWDGNQWTARNAGFGPAGCFVDLWGAGPDQVWGITYLRLSTTYHPEIPDARFVSV